MGEKTNIIAYADDVDFILNNKIPLTRLMEEVPGRLAEWFLTVNPDKTEVTELKREDIQDGKVLAQVQKAWLPPRRP